MRRSRTIGIVVVALGLIGIVGAGAKFGNRHGWPTLGQDVPTIYDDAHLLSEDQVSFIQDYHKELLGDHDIDYRVIGVAEAAFGDLDEMARIEFKEKSIGELSETGRGLLLLVDKTRNEVRLEVSSGLEGVYTDAFVSYIQHRQMIPFFKTGRVADGILATTEMIFARAQDAEAGKDFGPPMESGSMGGGVANPVAIGSGADQTVKQGADLRAIDGAPGVVLEAYRTAMDDRNGRSDLSIYSSDTRAMLANWTLTPAQMDNEANNLKKCGAGTTAVAKTHAVIRFPADQRHCPPYFFKVEASAWKLDLTMMQRAIRFNHRNQWHFDLAYDPRQAPYGFAFADWQFDQHGFAHQR